MHKVASKTISHTYISLKSLSHPAKRICTGEYNKFLLFHGIILLAFPIPLHHLVLLFISNKLYQIVNKERYEITGQSLRRAK